MSEIKLQTERLSLRPFYPGDGSGLFEYLSDEETLRYEPYDVFTEEECVSEALRRSQDMSFIAVCLKDNGKLIGNLYFSQEPPEHFKTWEIGFVFNPKYTGKGYAAEACRELMRYAFTELKAHRIIGKCNPENTASWRLMERLGMRREGLYKKPVFFKLDDEGKPLWHDAYEYAILSEGWK